MSTIVTWPGSANCGRAQPTNTCKKKIIDMKSFLLVWSLQPFQKYLNHIKSINIYDRGSLSILRNLPETDISFLIYDTNKVHTHSCEKETMWNSNRAINHWAILDAKLNVFFKMVHCNDWKKNPQFATHRLLNSLFSNINSRSK